MDDSGIDLNNLKSEVNKAIELLNIEALENEKTALEAKQNKPDFWNNNTAAQKDMQRLSYISQTISVWRKLESEISDTLELSNLNEASMASELSAQSSKLQNEFSVLRQQLLYNGPYDQNNAILAIYAGAGGTDAQDWAQMLLRMYIRWAEQNGYRTTLIQQSLGEEAGIKSATLEIAGDLAYGKLKGEHGVHRLVRLSPFNADNLRQTSFAKIDVLPEIDTPEDVEIDDKDLKIDVYRAGGHGGQSVNTTDSAVRVTHLPTGITVSIQNERSQLQNKETALTILRSRLAQLQIEQHAKSLQEIKGPNEQAAWGNQIRSYVLHPYTMVKDTRTKAETTDAQAVLDGKIDGFINAYLEQSSK